MEQQQSFAHAEYARKEEGHPTRQVPGQTERSEIDSDEGAARRVERSDIK
jgi:hypothetical protein